MGCRLDQGGGLYREYVYNPVNTRRLRAAANIELFSFLDWTLAADLVEKQIAFVTC